MYLLLLLLVPAMFGWLEHFSLSRSKYIILLRMYMYLKASTKKAWVDESTRSKSEQDSWSELVYLSSLSSFPCSYVTFSSVWGASNFFFFSGKKPWARGGSGQSAIGTAHARMDKAESSSSSWDQLSTDKQLFSLLLSLTIFGQLQIREFVRIIVANIKCAWLGIFFLRFVFPFEMQKKVWPVVFSKLSCESYSISFVHFCPIFSLLSAMCNYLIKICRQFYRFKNATKRLRQIKIDADKKIKKYK